MLCLSLLVLSFFFHLILCDCLHLLLCVWSQIFWREHKNFSVRQFWLKCTYIGRTRDISLPVVLSVHRFSPIDLTIIGGSSAVILFPHLPWHFRTERGTFLRKYNSKTFWDFSLGSAKRVLFCELGCVEDEVSPECADSLACNGAFK